MMSIRSAAPHSWFRILRTTRHLRKSQIAYRLQRFALKRIPFRSPRFGPRSSHFTSTYQPASQLPSVPNPDTGCHAGADLISELDRGTLTLVNQAFPLAVNSPDWRLGPQGENRLWAITLHYHAWLFELSRLIESDETSPSSTAPSSSQVAQADGLFCAFLHDWIRACTRYRPGVEDLAWNSYAIATRLGWWARLWYSLGNAYWDQHRAMADDFLRTMYAQASHLASHLEWDLRANHLLRDAVGLAWAGRFFQGKEPDRWLRTATRLALEQADEQMLADGGHFERSPFYHLEVMDDWLTLALLLPDERAAEPMRQAWSSSAEYARWLTHPDGRVAQFNDGAVASVWEYLDRGSCLPISPEQSTPRGGRHLPDSGVVAWHGDPWTVFWDVGEIGPDYQPGHAHADTLTIETSYAGRRLFVDPGCHSYDHNDIRRYDRATSSHNTVCIDETNSSEVWHIFRVGRRARIQDVSVTFHHDGFTGTASHTGYNHLPGRPRHERTVSLENSNALNIVDSLTGARQHVAEGGFLVDPAWSIEEVGGGWILSGQATRLAVSIRGNRPLTLSTEQRPIHPDYGVELTGQRLTWRYKGGFPLTVTTRIQPQRGAVE